MAVAVVVGRSNSPAPAGPDPGRPAGRPAPAAEPSGAGGTVDRNLRDLQEFLGEARDRDGQFRIVWDPGHGAARAPAFLDPRFELKWRRYLDSLVAWVVSLPEGADEATLQALDHQVAWSLHLIEDVRRVELDRSFVNAGGARGGDLKDTLQRYSVARMAWRGAQELCLDAAERLHAALPAPGPEVLLLQANLLRFSESPRLGEVIARLATSFASARGARSREAVGRMLVDLSGDTGVAGKIPCPVSVTAIRLAREGAADPRVALSSPMRFWLTAGAFELQFRFWRHCREAMAEEDRVWTEATLASYEARAPSLPERSRTTLRYRLEEVIRGSEQMAFAGDSRLVGLQERVRALLPSLTTVTPGGRPR